MPLFLFMAILNFIVDIMDRCPSLRWRTRRTAALDEPHPRVPSRFTRWMSRSNTTLVSYEKWSYKKIVEKVPLKMDLIVVLF